LVEAGLDEITLSTHGVNKETYKTQMQGASFDTYHHNLKTIVDLKRQLGMKTPAIRINYTVNPDNLAGAPVTSFSGSTNMVFLLCRYAR
jgi:hypothetical protein